jgi:hypothetical protein
MRLSAERRRAQTAKALRADPPLAVRSVHGGIGWAEKYRTLSAEDRARIAIRCVIGRYIWDAKRRGLPIPIFHAYTPERGPDGKLQAKPGSMRPMSEEDLANL